MVVALNMVHFLSFKGVTPIQACELKGKSAVRKIDEAFITVVNLE